MKKSGLELDFDEIRKRIESVKGETKPTVWAKKVGVTPNVVSNIHGQTNQKPSLEYIIAVAVATNKPVDYFLFGDDRETKFKPIDDDSEIAELLEGARRVLKSGNPVAFDALERNIRYFDHAVAVEKRLEKVEAQLEAVLNALSKTNEMKKAAVNE